MPLTTGLLALKQGKVLETKDIKTDHFVPYVQKVD